MITDQHDILSVNILVEWANGSWHYPASTRNKSHNIIEARIAQKYIIELENLTSQRLEVPISIDGLDIMTGQYFQNTQRGYVISPHSVVQIKGWRTNMSQSAAFRFGYGEQSYAAQIGRAGGLMGSIIINIFKENVFKEFDSHKFYRPLQSWDYFPTGYYWRPAAPQDYYPNKYENNFYSGNVRNIIPVKGLTLGTQFGESQEDRVTSTSFTRTSMTPISTIHIEYKNSEEFHKLILCDGTETLSSDFTLTHKEQFCQSPTTGTYY